jgi:threonine dehydratase
VERVVLVSDEAIVAAQQALWDGARIVAEPGAAARFAALVSGAYVPAPGERVGVVVCGANTTAGISGGNSGRKIDGLHRHP